MLLANTIHKIAKYFINLSIRYKLILIYIPLTIIPFLVLTGMSYFKSSSIILREAVMNSEQLVKQVADKVDYNFKEIDKNMLLLAWDDKTMNILKSHYSVETLSKRKANQIELEAAMQTFLNTRLEIESVYIYRHDGDEYYIDQTTFNKDVRKKILMKKTELISEAEEYMGKNKWIAMNLEKGLITGIRIIYDPITLEKLGILITNVQESYLRSLYDDIRVNKNSFFVIRDVDGTILSTNSSLNEREIYSILKGMKSSTGQLANYTSSLNVSGKFFIIGRTCNFTEWEILNIIPRDELLEGIRQNRVWIFLVALLCIIISTLLLLLFSSYIVNPIKQLIKVMKKVEKEDFSVSAEPTSQDEFGELTLVFNKMIKRIRYLIEEVYQQKIIKQEAEFKLLQAQINPHFLYNTLDSINWIAKMNGVEDISKMVIALGQLMRISISKGKKEITLAQEIEYINNYLLIQSMSYRDKFKVVIDVEEDMKNCILPKLILQPVVENALVHGIEKKLGKGVLIIKASCQSSKLVIDVIDDGVGMDPVQAKKILEYESAVVGEGENEIHTGIGISNVNKRIKIIYGNDYGVDIISEIGKGTDVRIVLPARFKKGDAT